MSFGRQGDPQSDLFLRRDELPCSADHPFYDRLQEILRNADSDRFVEDLCAPDYSYSAGERPSLLPRRYFH